MKRMMTAVLAIALVGVTAGAALAWGPRCPMMGGGMGPQMMGSGWQGGAMCPGRMGGDWAGCPGFAGTPGTAETPPGAVTEEKAKELATAYADKYFRGYTVERVLPFEGRLGTAYQIELKGPKGERRVLHVNPWGAVRPFGPLAATE